MRAKRWALIAYALFLSCETVPLREGAPPAGGLAPPLPTRPTHDSKVVLFGNLHAHSKLSDDVSTDRDEMAPKTAFEYAHQHGLDFLAITDHQKATDTSPRYFLTANEYKTQLFDVAMAYNQAHEGEFVAIPGLEWGTTATGNHVNLIGADAVPPDTILDAEYDELYTWAKTHCQFVQLNHLNCTEPIGEGAGECPSYERR